MQFISGHVYDVTEYVPYHPGGVSEIMKGAGIDGTALFNSVSSLCRVLTKIFDLVRLLSLLIHRGPRAK